METNVDIDVVSDA